MSPVNARKLLTAFVAQPGDRLLVTSEELQDGELLGHLRSAAGRERVDVAAPGEEATPAGTHRCASTLYMHVEGRGDPPVQTDRGHGEQAVTTLALRLDHP